MTQAHNCLGLVHTSTRHAGARVQVNRDLVRSLQADAPTPEAKLAMVGLLHTASRTKGETHSQPRQGQLLLAQHLGGGEGCRRMAHHMW